MKNEIAFPIWLYHKTKKPDGKILYSKEQFETLGEGWVESPAFFDQEPEIEEVQPKPPQKPKEQAPEIVEPVVEEKPKVEEKPEVAPEPEAKSYHEHMAKWPSKEDKKAEKPKAKSRKKAK